MHLVVQKEILCSQLLMMRRRSQPFTCARCMFIELITGLYIYTGLQCLQRTDEELAHLKCSGWKPNLGFEFLVFWLYPHCCLNPKTKNRITL